jgi:hypothetical protein
VLDEGHLDEAPGLVVSDVSFISVEKCLPVALDLAEPGADLVSLIKPQFEAGRDRVGKGGLVKDPGDHRRLHRLGLAPSSRRPAGRSRAWRPARSPAATARSSTCCGR